MSDPSAPQGPPAGSPSAPSTAGAMLRAAREKAGMHIGVLAATLKVPVRKIELLEGDRFDELPGATFARALSLSVCRVLKCDPAAVLAALPRQEGVASTLEQVSRGMNAPLSKRAGPEIPLRETGRPRWWWAALILAVMAGLWWVPSHWWDQLPLSALPQGPQATSAAGSSAASAPVNPSAPLQATSATAPPPPSAAASAAGLVQTVHGSPTDAVAAAAGTMPSAVSVTEPSWIEAADLQGRSVWARTLTPGEVVSLEGGAGFRLTIGNAAGTQVRWRGQPVDLAPVTRDNVARLELK